MGVSGWSESGFSCFLAALMSCLVVLLEISERRVRCVVNVCRLRIVYVSSGEKKNTPMYVRRHASTCAVGLNARHRRRHTERKETHLYSRALIFEDEE